MTDKPGTHPPVLRPSGRARWIALFAIGYVAVVLTVDALITMRVSIPFEWRELRVHLRNGVDVNKLLFWLVIPFAVASLRMDWGYWGVRRWKRADGWILLGVIAAGVCAMGVVAAAPSLRDIYPSLDDLSAEAKRDYALQNLLWILSWLPGWEFLHRYVLLRSALVWAPRWGWVVVPVSEGLYHLQKPGLEALGMAAFSTVLTLWALKRRNALLPLLGHLTIEIELLVFRLVV